MHQIGSLICNQYDKFNVITFLFYCVRVLRRLAISRDMAIFCRSLHLECAQMSGVRRTRICLRSVMYQSSLLGGITLVSASYIKSLMENASYRMLLYLTYSTTYFTRSNVANRYVLPFAHTNLLQGSYFHRTISLWNSLPASITTTTSLPSFKRKLTHVH